MVRWAIGVTALALTLFTSRPSHACSFAFGPDVVSMELPTDGALSVKVHCPFSDCFAAEDINVSVLDSSGTPVPGTHTVHDLFRDGGFWIAWVPAVALTEGQTLNVHISTPVTSVSDTRVEVVVVGPLGSASPFGNVEATLSIWPLGVGQELCCSSGTCGDACFHAEQQDRAVLTVDPDWGLSPADRVLKQFLYRIVPTSAPDIENPPPFGEYFNASWAIFETQADEYCGRYEALRLADGVVIVGDEVCRSHGDLPALGVRPSTKAEARNFLENAYCEDLSSDPNDLLCDVGADTCSSDACSASPSRSPRDSFPAVFLIIAASVIAKRRRPA